MHGRRTSMEFMPLPISLEAILELPWYVGLVGVALVIMLIWSALWSLLTLRLVKALTRFILAFVVLIILSQGGEALVQLIDSNATPPGR